MKSPKPPPPPPPPPPPAPMPDPENVVAEKKTQRDRSRRSQQSGRASTFLSQSLGGN